MNDNPYRLSSDIEPLVYSIELEPDLERFTFQGREKINFRARKPFFSITLHCLDIRIRHAAVSGADAIHPAIKAEQITYNEKWETVTLDFGQILRPADVESLDIIFEGILNDQMHGFYRTSYQVGDEKRWGAATQFEATDARRAFPCWDEPDKKAKFNVTLRVPNHLTALSNMPVIDERHLGGTHKQLTYDETPVMSTYLLCFVVADLEYLEGEDKNGVAIRIYTTPGKKEQGIFALEVAKHTLPYFAEWFDIPYALPKMDMVALPDFASGAMENWGLVTYRETALLVDPKNSSAQARQRVAEVIDHELAHQWFGNLVTMEWWTDLWLNEGFASYMGPKAVDSQFPGWKIWDQFVVADFMTALHGDSLKNTHPIEIPVQNPAEIREIFDPITYSKGSVVNRMLEHYLGGDVFREGLRVYLKKYAYQNAQTKDLWHTLEQVSGKPVRKIMAGYTKQGGYPVLQVKSRMEKGKRVLDFEQRRFFFDGRRDKENLRWDVPLVISAPDLKKPFIGLMEERRTEIRLPSKSKWIKVNSGQSGFYRVAYPADLLQPLTQAMQSNRLDSAIDYLGILDDSLALAKAGEIKTSKALDVLASSKNQKDFNVWVTLAGGLGSIKHILSGQPAEAKFDAFAKSLMKPLFQKIGWDAKPKDTHTDFMLRSTLISNLGYYGEESVIREAKKRFAQFVKGAELPPNLRAAIYSLVSRYGGAKELDQLMDIYKKSTLQEERVRILRALARFRDKALIRKVLDFSLSPEVRNQDAYVVLASMGGNSSARAMAWNYIKSKWPVLRERYQGSAVSLLGRILEGAASGFLTEAEYRDVESFFQKHPMAGIERTMKQTLEVIRCNISWAQRDRLDVASWLKSLK